MWLIKQHSYIVNIGVRKKIAHIETTRWRFKGLQFRFVLLTHIHADVRAQSLPGSSKLLHALDKQFSRARIRITILHSVEEFDGDEIRTKIVSQNTGITTEIFVCSHAGTPANFVQIRNVAIGNC